jgi:hypothetical protein
MTLREPAGAAASYRKAREIEASIYGEDHPELIATKLSFPAGTLKIESTWGVCDN